MAALVCCGLFVVGCPHRQQSTDDPQPTTNNKQKYYFLDSRPLGQLGSWMNPAIGKKDAP